jgi:hypothetical protein
MTEAVGRKINILEIRLIMSGAIHLPPFISSWRKQEKVIFEKEDNTNISNILFCELRR